MKWQTSSATSLKLCNSNDWNYLPLGPTECLNLGSAFNILPLQRPMEFPVIFPVKYLLTSAKETFENETVEIFPCLTTLFLDSPEEPESLLTFL